MAKQIKYVDKSANADHVKHITHLGTETNRYSKKGLVRRIKEGKEYYTVAGDKRAYLEVVKPVGGEEYVRTEPDSSKKDNLLSLPKCPAGLTNKKD